MKFEVSGERRGSESDFVYHAPGPGGLSADGFWDLFRVFVLCCCFLYGPKRHFSSRSAHVQQMFKSDYSGDHSLLTVDRWGFIDHLSASDWFGVALIPVILSLVVILLSLWGKRIDRRFIVRRIPPYHLRRTMGRSWRVEQVADRRHNDFLGWLGVWQILHWRYALDIARCGNLF